MLGQIRVESLAHSNKRDNFSPVPSGGIKLSSIYNLPLNLTTIKQTMVGIYMYVLYYIYNLLTD